MKTVCSLCLSHMDGPTEDEEVSHGLCPDCEREYFPDLTEGPKCRCLISDGFWVAVLDPYTCDSCRERDGKPYDEGDPGNFSHCDHVCSGVA